jgi:hypothetical protein
MMIIMFRNEVQVIYQPHRGLEARVRKRPRKCCCVERVNMLQQMGAGIAERRQNFLDGPRIVMCFVSGPIRKVGRGHVLARIREIVDTRQP